MWFLSTGYKYVYKQKQRKILPSEFYPSKPKLSFNITNKYYQFNVNQISFPIEMLRLSQENLFVNFN